MIDLRRIGKRNFFEDLNVNFDRDIAGWGEWGISSESEDKKIVVQKDIGDDLTLKLRTIMNDELYHRSPDSARNNEVELEYSLRDYRNIKMILKENEGFFGIEHSMKF
jgi:hypothetical protein